MPKAESRSSGVPAYSPYSRPSNKSNETPSDSFPSTTYRLNFGSYAGKTLNECRPDYVSWLIKTMDKYAPRPDLMEAIKVYQEHSLSAQRSIGHEGAAESSNTSGRGQSLCDPDSSEIPVGIELMANSSDTPNPGASHHLRPNGNSSPSPKTTELQAKEDLTSSPRSTERETNAAINLAQSLEAETPLANPAEAASNELENRPASYLLDFGKHRGVELSKVPLGYMRWMIKNNLLVGKPLLRQAMIDAGLIDSTTGQLCLSSPVHNSEPFSSEPKPVKEETTQAPKYIKQEPTEAPKYIKQEEITESPKYIKQEITESPKYVLDFGKHKGSRLSDVPPSYLSFLAHQCTKTMPRLKQIMTDEGFLDPSTGELRSAHIHSGTPDCKEKDLTEADIKTAPYVLDFGKHMGLTLSEVPLHYLAFLAKECMDTRPILRQAMFNEGHLDSSTGEVHTYRSISTIWTLPRLPRFSRIFIDEWNNAHLWISEGDVYKHFQMSRKICDGLPLVRGKSSKKRKVYYLYHVYELLKRLRSELVALQAVSAWLILKEERESDVMAGMGLGACLLDTPSW